MSCGVPRRLVAGLVPGLLAAFILFLTGCTYHKAPPGSSAGLGEVPDPPPGDRVPTSGHFSIFPREVTAPPADFNTEEYGVIDESGFAAVVNKPLSTFSIDVDTAAYANVRRFLRDGQLPPADAVRIEELINYFRLRLP